MPFALIALQPYQFGGGERVESADDEDATGRTGTVKMSIVLWGNSIIHHWDTEEYGMKVVVWKSPSFLKGLLRLLFGFKGGE